MRGAGENADILFQEEIKILVDEASTRVEEN